MDVIRCLFVFMLAAAPFFDGAAQARPLEIQDELQRRSPTAWKFSPDGGLVAVTTRQLAGFERHWNEAARIFSDDGVRRHSGQQLSIVEVQTGRALYTSDASVSAYDAVWAADGKSLVFFARDAIRSQIWSWRRAGGRVEKGLGEVADRLLSVNGNSFQLLEDGKRIVARIPLERLSETERRLRAMRRASGTHAVHGDDSWRPVVFTANRESWSDKALRPAAPELAASKYELAIWERKSGRKQTIETAAGVQSFSVSPDSRYIAYWRFRDYEKIPLMAYFYDLVLHEVGAAQSRELLSRQEISPREAAIVWSPDSAAIHFQTQKTESTGAPPQMAWSLQIAPGSSPTRVESTSAVRGIPWELPANAASAVLSPDGSVALFVRQAADIPPGLWISRKSDPTPQPLAGFVPASSDVELGQSKRVEYLSSDGVQLKAALLLPPGYDGKTPAPMVTWVYPGRQSRAVNTYGLGGSGPMNAQLLASRGYAVLKPDSVMHDGWPVESLARSILPAVTTMIERGIADPTKIGLLGHSQGGMSVVALLTRSTLFKAAVTSNGYYNVLSLYGALNMRGVDSAAFIMEEYNHIFTTPWRNQRVILENSPVLNLDRVKTPLLMVVGLGDVSVPPQQAEEVYVGLKRLGSKVTLVEYPAATHVPYDWETRQQVDYAGRMIAWFDEHLRSPEARP